MGATSRMSSTALQEQLNRRLRPGRHAGPVGPREGRQSNDLVHVQLHIYERRRCDREGHIQGGRHNSWRSRCTARRQSGDRTAHQGQQVASPWLCSIPRGGRPRGRSPRLRPTGRSSKRSIAGLGAAFVAGAEQDSMRRLGRRLTQKTREGAPALPGGRLARCRNGRLEPPCRESGQHVDFIGRQDGVGLQQSS
jgi:hypothetical protein